MVQKRNSRGQVTGNGATRGVLPDYMVANQIGRLVDNVQTLMRRYGSTEPDPRRDLNKECGYPETSEITISDYRDLYDREGVAKRVVEVLPRECWMVSPEVFESEDAEKDDTPFEEGWKGLADNLHGESWYQDEEGNPIWEFLLRLDIFSGLGRFGVMLLGLDDGKPLSEPAEPREGQQLMFLRIFAEDAADITKWETDPSSGRFGEPTEYMLKFADPKNPSLPSVDSQRVHWTRIQHTADNLEGGDTFGNSRMKSNENRLWDLRKIYCSSAEMYYKGAFPGISWETHPQLGGDVVIDKAAMRTEIEKLWNSLERSSVTKGMTAKSLATQVVDPTPQINAQINAICIEIDVPMRIFMGSERGELASSQDDSTWNDRLRGRQQSHVTPHIVVPFVNRMIFLKVLPEPEGFSVVWPDLDALTDEQKAAVALKRTEAMAKYIQGDVESIMVPLDFFTRILDMTQEEAEAVVKAATQMLEEHQDEEEELEGKAQELLDGEVAAAKAQAQKAVLAEGV